MRLGTAGNTNGPALYILETIKQYTVYYDCDDSSNFSQWIAVKDNHQFFADGPEELLGMVNIYEILGEDWNRYSPYDRTHIFQREIPDDI